MNIMGCGGSKTKVASKTIDSLSASDVSAAAIIQRWFRRKMAEIELRRQCSWKIFTDLEYKSEQDQLELMNFFSDLDSLTAALEEYRAKRLESEGASKSHKVPTLSLRNSEGGINLTQETEDALFSRPNESPDLTLETVRELIQGVQNGYKIKCELVLAILDESFQLQKTFANIRMANSRTSHRVTVLGDLHGNFIDLLTVFEKNGLPSDLNPYIVNGDFVDRGPCGVETCIILLAFQILYPHSVFVNRGNHEDFLMNKKYGFEQEVVKKYTDRASKVLRAFATVFCALPLGSIVNDQVLVIHGGIGEDMDMAVLSKLKRIDYVSVLRAAKKRTAAQDPEEAKHIVNALWSDPGKKPGVNFNKHRGGGSVWGKDVTKSFLDMHGLRMIVRAHECCQEGYKWTHDSMVLTVFSASNYYSEGSNLGAYVRFDAETQPHIVQYDASLRLRGRRISLRGQVSIIEKAAIQSMKETLLEQKHELVAAFQSKDTDGTGTCSATEWAEILTKVTGLSVPWLVLKENFVTTTVDGKVEYMTTLNVHAESNALSGKADAQVVDSLYQNLGTLEFIFRLIDVDSSGSVSKEEFTLACETLNKYLGREEMKKEEIAKMTDAMDLDGNGLIDFNEFTETFRLMQK